MTQPGAGQEQPPANETEPRGLAVPPPVPPAERASTEVNKETKEILEATEELKIFDSRDILIQPEEGLEAWLKFKAACAAVKSLELPEDSSPTIESWLRSAVATEAGSRHGSYFAAAHMPSPEEIHARINEAVAVAEAAAANLPGSPEAGAERPAGDRGPDINRWARERLEQREKLREEFGPRIELALNQAGEENDNPDLSSLGMAASLELSDLDNVPFDDPDAFRRKREKIEERVKALEARAKELEALARLKPVREMSDKEWEQYKSLLFPPLPDLINLLRQGKANLSGKIEVYFGAVQDPEMISRVQNAITPEDLYSLADALAQEVSNFETLQKEDGFIKSKEELLLAHGSRFPLLMEIEMPALTGGDRFAKPRIFSAGLLRMLEQRIQTRLSGGQPPGRKPTIVEAGAPRLGVDSPEALPKPKPIQEMSEKDLEEVGELLPLPLRKILEFLGRDQVSKLSEDIDNLFGASEEFVPPELIARVSTAAQPEDLYRLADDLIAEEERYKVLYKKSLSRGEKENLSKNTARFPLLAEIYLPIYTYSGSRANGPWIINAGILRILDRRIQERLNRGKPPEAGPSPGRVVVADITPPRRPEGNGGEISFGENPPSAEEILEDPEKVLRLLVRYYEQGPWKQAFDRLGFSQEEFDADPATSKFGHAASRAFGNAKTKLTELIYKVKSENGELDTARQVVKDIGFLLRQTRQLEQLAAARKAAKPEREVWTVVGAVRFLKDLTPANVRENLPTALQATDFIIAEARQGRIPQNEIGRKLLKEVTEWVKTLSGMKR